MAINVFIRQPFTEAAQREMGVVQGVLDLVQSLNGNPVTLESLTGLEAQSESTFRQNFEKETGLEYTPENFRNNRLELLARADAMIFIRTGLTESGAFEVAFNIYKGNKVPVFFAIWKKAPMRDTFLKDLEQELDVTYVEFEDPKELEASLRDFFEATEKKIFAAPSLKVEVGTSD
jgi:carbamoyl-phosphate synthase large subunit